jgi:hypothetical protein
MLVKLLSKYWFRIGAEIFGISMLVVILYELLINYEDDKS